MQKQENEKAKTMNLLEWRTKLSEKMHSKESLTLSKEEVSELLLLLLHSYNFEQIKLAHQCGERDCSISETFEIVNKIQ